MRELKSDWRATFFVTLQWHIWIFDIFLKLTNTHKIFQIMLSLGGMFLGVLLPIFMCSLLIVNSLLILPLQHWDSLTLFTDSKVQTLLIVPFFIFLHFLRTIQYLYKYSWYLSGGHCTEIFFTEYYTLLKAISGYFWVAYWIWSWNY